MRKVWSDGGYGPRLFSGLAIGFVAAMFAATLAGWGLALAERMGAPAGTAEAYRAWLAGGGWLKVPMWGAGIATLLSVRHAVNWPQRLLTGWFIFEFCVMPFLVHTNPAPGGENSPQTARAKTRAILKWSYRSPETVARIVALSRDADPIVREQAVLALGQNVIVADVEHSAVTRPSRFATHPVRDSLRVRLIECLRDPAETVRAEAARALWKAPLAFGTQPAAAETLAAVLDRATDPARPERLAWLALDAASGAPHPFLQAAAERFANTTDDSGLARYARLAAEERR